MKKINKNSVKYSYCEYEINPPLNLLFGATITLTGGGRGRKWAVGVTKSRRNRPRGLAKPHLFLGGLGCPFVLMCKAHESLLCTL